ncbi:alpha-L-glutamate ligase [Alkalihalophilus pseudofirmus]|nr:alpha-L-glutamate ligase [Alkalihalophilus pseudofirmus]
MKHITFNPYRTIGIPNTTYLKSDSMFQHIDQIKESDWVLFPEYWQVNSLVYGLKKKIFPSVNSYHLGHDKIEMTRALKAICPQHVPYTLILPNNEFGIETVLNEMPFPFIAKEVRNSMGKGVYLIHDVKELREYASVSHVLYVQEQLPIDRDMRIVYVGDDVIAAYWRVGNGESHLNNVAQGGEILLELIPREAIDLVKHVAETLGINHAGFDVAMVDNQFYIFEFNILFGNIGFQQLDVSVENKIYDYIQKEDSKLNLDTMFVS